MGIFDGLMLQIAGYAILIGLIIFACWYLWNETSVGKCLTDPLACLSPTGMSTCTSSAYGAIHGLGATGGPTCPAGQDLYGGLCYKGCPKGYDRTAAITCARDGAQVITDCGMNASVPTDCGPGMVNVGGLCYQGCPVASGGCQGTRTGVNTCDYGPIVKIWTDGRFTSQDAVNAVAATLGADEQSCWAWMPNTISATHKGPISWYGGIGTIPSSCSNPAFPIKSGSLCFVDWKQYLTKVKGVTDIANWKQTAVCSATNSDIQTDGTKYGLADPSTPTVCPDGSDYYLSACYTSACPKGWKRTAVATCQMMTQDELAAAKLTLSDQVLTLPSPCGTYPAQTPSATGSGSSTTGSGTTTGASSFTGGRLYLAGRRSNFGGRISHFSEIDSYLGL